MFVHGDFIEKEVEMKYIKVFTAVACALCTLLISVDSHAGSHSVTEDYSYFSCTTKVEIQPYLSAYYVGGSFSASKKGAAEDLSCAVYGVAYNNALAGIGSYSGTKSCHDTQISAVGSCTCSTEPYKAVGAQTFKTYFRQVETY